MFLDSWGNQSTWRLWPFIRPVSYFIVEKHKIGTSRVKIHILRLWTFSSRLSARLLSGNSSLCQGEFSKLCKQHRTEQKHTDLGQGKSVFVLLSVYAKYPNVLPRVFFLFFSIFFKLGHFVPQQSLQRLRRNEVNLFANLCLYISRTIANPAEPLKSEPRTMLFLYSIIAT